MQFNVVRGFKRKKRDKYQIPGAHFALLSCYVFLLLTACCVRITVLFHEYMQSAFKTLSALLLSAKT